MFNKAWAWIKDKWNQFNNWLAFKMPGLKTKIIMAVGAVGSFAGVLQDYLTGLPLSTFLTATHIAIITGVLFTLGFWARMMTDRN